MNPLHPVSSISYMKPDRQEEKNAKQLTKIAMVIALIAIPVICFLSPKSCNVLDDLKVSPIKSQENLDYCKNFVATIEKSNIVLIQDINKLAKKFDLFGKRNFNEKVFEDCLKTRGMGTTNEELADHLDNILLKESKPQVFYNPASQAKSTIGKCSQTQLLQNPSSIVSCCWHKKKGFNIFNEDVPLLLQRFKNLRNNVVIGITKKIIENIRNYGFYDGFDPVDATALLTGHSVDAINQAIGDDTPNDKPKKHLSSIIVHQGFLMQTLDNS